MKRILINIHYLEIGGAERALLGLLAALDPQKVKVDLFLNQHTGEFLPLIPKWINLLPEVSEYKCIEAPIKNVLKKKHFLIALARVWAKCKHYIYAIHLTEQQRINDSSMYQYIFNAIEPFMPQVQPNVEYDLAISFLGQRFLTLSKEKARKKVTWIHTDYSTVHVNVELEKSSWEAFDKIVSISSECTSAFLKKFPLLANKIVEIENILSPTFIRQQAELGDVSKEMPDENGIIKILSIGRFSRAKRFEGIPHICAEMEKKGIDFKWYVIGYGPDAEIQAALDQFNMRHRMILLGKKVNPYPYIKACDIYAQPSIFEGKSVTVREAQILCKPVLITHYATALSQVKDGEDGVIVPLDEEGAAKGIVEFIQNTELRAHITEYLKTHDYGNESEVEKIYDLMK